MIKFAFILFGTVFGVLLQAVIYGAAFAAVWFAWIHCQPDKRFPIEWVLLWLLLSDVINSSLRYAREAYQETFTQPTSTDH